MKYKKIIGILLIVITLTMTISSSSAKDIWIHTYGHGAAGSPAHWESPNGFKFHDNAWILAFCAYYQINFYDDSGKEISYVKDHITSGSNDRVVHIPNGSAKMKIIVSTLTFEKDANGSHWIWGSNRNYVTIFDNLKPCKGAMAFDGMTGHHNFHIKTDNYDSGYIELHSC